MRSTRLAATDEHEGDKRRGEEPVGDDARLGIEAGGEVRLGSTISPT